MCTSEKRNYLYHYTSLENLALILKNRTIRLNPLTKMDDPQEQRASDLPHLGKYVFISSWTFDKKEDIPMWKMYAPLSSGVRIALYENPFVWHETTGREYEDAIGVPASNTESRETVIHTFLNGAEMWKNDIFSPQGQTGNLLNKVIYTDDPALLEPQTVYTEGDMISLRLGKMGIYKNTYWKFQKECRYIMHFYRLPRNADPEIQAHLGAIQLYRMIHNMDAAPFDYYDLDIESSAFEKMIITPSPRMSPGNRILFNALVNAYNPTATIRESELLNLL